jgi:hypothetical protein
LREGAEGGGEGAERALHIKGLPTASRLPWLFQVSVMFGSIFAIISVFIAI